MHFNSYLHAKLSRNEIYYRLTSDPSFDDFTCSLSLFINSLAEGVMEWLVVTHKVGVPEVRFAASRCDDELPETSLKSDWKRLSMTKKMCTWCVGRLSTRFRFMI
jgi:hypothetical protein